MVYGIKITMNWCLYGLYSNTFSLKLFFVTYKWLLLLINNFPMSSLVTPYKLDEIHIT